MDRRPERVAPVRPGYVPAAVTTADPPLDPVPGLPSDLRVLHVVTRYSGGSMRRLLDVAATVPGTHTVVVGPDSDPGRLGELDGLAEVVVCDPLRREVSTADAAALGAVRTVIRRVRPHVVHTHQSKGGLIGRAAARAAGVPIVYHSASMASFGPGYARAESAAFRLAEWASAPMVDRYFVVGRDLLDRLANGARIPRRKLTLVRSTIDRGRFAPVDADGRAAARRDLGLPVDGRVVVYVGSLEPRKGTATLPGIVAAADPEAVLVLAGTGPDHDDVVAAGARSGVRTELLGHVGEVGRLMGAADVVVLPSEAEGLPQVLVQTAMVGVPFVAYDVDGVREMIDAGAAGTAVPLGDVDAFAAGVGRWLDGTGRVPVRPPSWDAWSRDHVGEQYRAAYAADLAPRH